MHRVRGTPGRRGRGSLRPALRAARADGAAAAERDAKKRAKYATSDPAGYTFVPLSVESYGRLGKPAMQLLADLASEAELAGAVSTDSFVENALRMLSVSLCKGNALMFRRELGLLASATGADLQPGDPVPSADFV